MLKPDEIIDQEITCNKMVNDYEWNIIRDNDAENS